MAGLLVAWANPVWRGLPAVRAGQVVEYNTQLTVCSPHTRPRSSSTSSSSASSRHDGTGSGVRAALDDLVAQRGTR